MKRFKKKHLYTIINNATSIFVSSLITYESRKNKKANIFSQKCVYVSLNKIIINYIVFGEKVCESDHMIKLAY